MDAKKLEKTLKQHVVPHAKGYVLRGTRLIDCSVLPWLLRGYEFETSPDPHFTRLYAFTVAFCWPKPKKLKSPSRHAKPMSEELAWKGWGYFYPEVTPEIEREVFADALRCITGAQDCMRIATIGDYLAAVNAKWGNDPDLDEMMDLACAYAAMDQCDTSLALVGEVRRYYGTGRGRLDGTKELFAEVDSLAKAIERGDGSHKAIQRLWTADWCELYKVQDEFVARVGAGA